MLFVEDLTKMQKLMLFCQTLLICGALIDIMRMFLRRKGTSFACDVTKGIKLFAQREVYGFSTLRQFPNFAQKIKPSVFFTEGFIYLTTVQLSME